MEITSRYKLIFLVAMIVNYTSILTSVAIWENGYLAYALSVVVGLSFGLLMKRFEDLVVLTMISYVVASVVTVFAVMVPAVFTGAERVQVDAAILGGSGAVIYNSFVIIPFTIVSGIIGLFVSDRFLRGSKIPKFALN